MRPLLAELRRHFDRRVVIGLHRVNEFYDHLYTEWDGWFPGTSIELFPAIDARKCKPPPWWTDIPALWACGESHRQVIARALSDEVQHILIMEDDCVFTPEAKRILPEFMAQVPSDWDGLMLGGQVSVFDGKTTPVASRVSKCVQVERLHCYALSRSGMQKFHDILCEPTSVANDYRWGDAQEDGRLTVYRCEPFIAYQADGMSSISGRVEASRIWDDRVDVRLRKKAEIPIVSLVCPYDVLTKLRDAGVITNGGETPVQMATQMPERAERGEVEIADITLERARNAPDQFHRFLGQMLADAAFHRSAVLSLWHPSEFIPYDCPRVSGDTVEAVTNNLLTSLRRAPAGSSSPAGLFCARCE